MAAQLLHHVQGHDRRKRLTKRVVESLEPRQREYVVWNEKVPRFGVRVSPKGIRSYMVK